MALYKSNTGGGAGPSSSLLARGLAFSGLSGSDDTAQFFDDYLLGASATVLTGWQQQLNNAAAIAMVVTNGAGGLYTANTGATANTICDVNTTPSAVTNTSTAKWYIAFRQKITTTPDANTRALSGLLNTGSTKSVTAGFNGPQSATNFIVQYDGAFTGSFIDFGVAVDTAFHVFEIYCNGDTRVRGRIDKGAEVSAVQAAPGTGEHAFYNSLRNGATAATQTVVRDWFSALTPRI